ncbi:MerR family transcriptional regulator [Nocardiopsis sp. CNT312]|uniref:helix-turn-helix domain-containing protein n=1 Tax=Nocardiopsis sp. CNT312 TaxID=1137268 RepID=UPI0004B95F2A|nr:MerR family transcriptional regulator [Nocardiopsis sp. CNT312]
MKSSGEELSIGDLAAGFGLATHVLRHWEAAGVLRPARRVGDRRRYTREHRLRVALILQAQAAGFSLEQIRALVEAPDGPARRGLMREHLAELDDRIARLRATRDMMACAADCGSEDVLECPTMRSGLESVAAEGGRAAGLAAHRAPFGVS